jgi:uncharacterized cupin superfamily protein
MPEEIRVHLNEVDLEWNVETSPKGRFEVHEKFLSNHLAAPARVQASFESPDGPVVRQRPFEVDIVRVPPGKWAWPRHYHSVQWEYYIVLSGHGEMVQEEGTASLPMTPGEHIIQPPGWIHTIANTGDEDLVYYVIADNPDDEHCFYPDSQKWSAANAVYRPQKVGYWDGEE